MSSAGRLCIAFWISMPCEVHRSRFSHHRVLLGHVVGWLNFTGANFFIYLHGGFWPNTAESMSKSSADPNVFGTMKSGHCRIKPYYSGGNWNFRIIWAQMYWLKNYRYQWEKRSTSYLMQVIGRVIQIGNSSCILEIATDSRKLDEVYRVGHKSLNEFRRLLRGQYWDHK